LLHISGHKALLSQLLNPREDLLFLSVVVASNNLVPALAIANEVFVIFGLDMRSLEVNAGLR
jgi:hypothetical protein